MDCKASHIVLRKSPKSLTKLVLLFESLVVEGMTDFEDIDGGLVDLTEVVVEGNADLDKFLVVEGPIFFFL